MRNLTIQEIDNQIDMNKSIISYNNEIFVSEGFIDPELKKENEKAETFILALTFSKMSLFSCVT